MNIDKINNYAKDHSCSETKLLSELRRETELKYINPIMLSGEYQGRLLSLISKIKQPKKSVIKKTKKKLPISKNKSK